MTTPDPEPPPAIDVRDLLNTQTGRIAWSELQRPFAQGLVLLIDSQIDLIDVAARLVEDEQDAVRAWLDTGKLVRPGLDHARLWQAESAEFWAVVTAPWVLVQEAPPRNAGE